MSFTFNWPRFSDQFHYDAIQMLNTALNKGNKPPIIADKIEVVELEMGTQPPELEIRDIGELTVDQFRGIFRLTYSGDAHLVLKTKVQANPLNHKQPDIHLMTGSYGMLAAKQPLAVPMLLRLSHFRLNSYVVLVVSKQKGITLVFKTDPLQNVDINSTFDSIAVIQKFIQREIEEQLRQMFREDLPGIIHRLSQQWVKAKVEAPYLNKPPPPISIPRQPYDTMSAPDLSAPKLGRISTSAVGLQQHLTRAHSLGMPSVKRPRSVSGESAATSNRRSTPAKLATTQRSSPDLNIHGEYESFDPTYGLRPEGLPTKSGFKGFSSLFTPNKGLADLTEESGETDEGEEYEDDATSNSFDVVDWEDTVPGISPPPSVYAEPNHVPEYETIPAVGGGTITRPRILHSQSSIQPPPGISPHSSLASPYAHFPGNIRSGAMTPGHITRYSYPGSYFPDMSFVHSHPSNLPPRPPFYPTRPRTPDSADTDLTSSNSGNASNDNPLLRRGIHENRPPDIHGLSTAHRHDPDLSNDPIYIQRPRSERRLSVSSSVSHQSTSTTHTHQTSSVYPDPAPKIILRPSLNNDSIHQLSTLSHLNHTLSPYTRSLLHFTVRSVPPRSWSGGSGGAVGAGFNGKLPPGAERQPVKAKRKRIFRIGTRKDGTPTGENPGSSLDDIESSDANERAAKNQHARRSSVPPEFDAEDMDRYFRSNEDPSIPPPLQGGTLPLSPPEVSTLPVAQQYRHQRQGVVKPPLHSESPTLSGRRR